MRIETFELERWLTTYELGVEADITESGIAPLTFQELLDLESDGPSVLAHLLETRLGYSEACGSLELRSLIAGSYVNTEPEHILITTGAIEANFLALNVMLSRGADVVVVSPAYQELISVPRAIGCDVSLWQLRPDNGFRYNLDELDDLVTDRTKMVVINTPHNPTGTMLRADELRRIYDTATDVGAIVLCDEAYRWLEHPGGLPIPAPVRDFGDAAISVGSFSKAFGIPGIRIGWLAGPAELVASCWAMRDYTTLSPAKLSDALAIIAFRNREKVFARNAEIIRANMALATEWVGQQSHLTWVPPDAGLLALLKYDLDIDSHQLANLLATDYGALVAPGSAFGYEGYMRLGLGQRPEVFADGLRRVEKCLTELGE